MSYKDNLVKKPKHLIGKTIAAAVQSDYAMYLRFTDDTFAILEHEEEQEGFGYATHHVRLQKDCGRTDYNLVKIGVITKEEHERVKRMYELQEEEREKERELFRQKEIETQEKMILETLRKKYEQQQ